MAEIVNDRVLTFEVNVNNVQRVAHKKQRKKDRKVMSLIHQRVDPNVFEKIIEEESFEGEWDKLKNLYGGDEKLKRVKLQTLRKQFDMTQIKEDESILTFFSCVVLLTKQMKVCGESIIGCKRLRKC